MNDMKEITVVTTCELTGIYNVEDESCVRDTDEMAEILKAKLNADHVQILNNQVFVRDLPNQ